MLADQLLSFDSYRFDPGHGHLWRGKQEVKLTLKALALLCQLVQQAGQVVSKAELFRLVWPDTVVSDTTLTSCILELRQALQDNARQPRYIETVHRRGYRFIGAVRSPRSEVRSQNKPTLTPILVGREAELAQLHKWLDKSLCGERQLAFVTGEPGIGKTTLVEAFLQSLELRGQSRASRRQSRESRVQSRESNPPSTPPDDVQTPDPRRQTLDASLWLARGQCIEHYGAGEAYLPLLEALGRLGREAGGQRLIELLSQQAPTWLVQMPALLRATELEALQRRTQGATRERMLRELAEAVERLTAERPVVLWLEDLQWSDVSTLDWLALVARWREPARLLVIGTYRPVDVLVREHPLRAMKQELQVHGYCTELQLDFLSEEEVAEYLAVRFSVGAQHAASLRSLARVIYRRTDGNPLFMVNVVDYLVARGVLVQSDGRWELKGREEEVAGGVPESLQQLIEQQIERLRPGAQRMLEVASVVGAEFSAAAVAAGMETEVDVIEEQCEGLVRREHFLRASGTEDWPDGTVAARYGFLHALYQEVLYHRLTARRRQRLHQRIGEREEQGYGEQAREIAAELALHFERGREYRKAVQYLQHAGENAVRRSANQEAVSLLTKGLELLKTLPDTSDRAQQELRLQVALGIPLIATKGYATPEVGKTYARARELCQQIGIRETPQLFPVLWGVHLFYLLRAEYKTARELAEQCLTLAQSIQDPALLVQAHRALKGTLLWLGELTLAREHAEQGIAIYNPQQHRSLAFLYGQDPGVDCLSYAASALWYLGYSDQALKRIHEALTLAQELTHPYSVAFACSWAARVHQHRREGQATQEWAEAVIALSTEQGFPYWTAVATIMRGWALAEQGQGKEGIAQIRQGMAVWRAMGQELSWPSYLALLAGAYGKAGQAEEGLSVLTEALAAVDKTGERVYEAELYRLKGQLTLQKFQVSGSKFQVQNSPEPVVRSPESEAEECFLKAIEIARQQQAKSLELRAVMSLSRLWQQQGKKEEARKMLAEIYGWFTEGFDTKDLQEAEALLHKLK